MQAWHCSITSTTQDCWEVATTTATSSQVVTYQDWLQINLWILFFLAVLCGGFFFKLFKVK